MTITRLTRPQMAAIGGRIYQARKAANLSQKQLAAKITMHSCNVSRMEAGFILPDAKKLIRLSLALNVSTDWILGLETQS